MSRDDRQVRSRSQGHSPEDLGAPDVHPIVAMAILRHSQIAVTMNVYSEVSSAETREALRRLGGQLDGI